MYRAFKKLILFVLAFSVMAMATVGFYGCAVTTGAFSLSSLSVNGNDLKTTYEIGEAVDFSSVSAVATFSDKTQKTLTFGDLKFSVGDKVIDSAVAEGLTEVEGEVTVVVSYSHNDVTKTAELKFSVVKDAEEEEQYLATEFTDSDENSRISAATTTNADYDTDKLNFESQFYASEEVIRLVGDDNAFIFKPTLTLETDDGEPFFPTKYFFDAEVYVLDEEEVKLNAEVGEDGIVDFSLNGTEILSLDKENFAYKFTENAVGKEFRIRVVPTDAYLLGPAVKAISLNVKVIDGFNVHTAADLSVIDNVNNEAWFDIKNANGLVGVTPNAIIFQKKITVTEKDIPSSFYYELSREPIYYNAQDHENPLEDANVSNLRIDDEVLIYHRAMKSGSFAIHGNFFTVDFTAVPVASAFADGEHKGYGTDFSNVAAICLEDLAETVEARQVEYSVSNLKAVGNAPRSQLEEYLPSTGDYLPVNAGGMIFLRIEHNNYAKINNVIASTFFIGWISHESKITLENIKCYESYQNAGFIWGDSDNTVINSTMERSGGPLFILQHINPQNNPNTRIPQLKVHDSHLISLVTGQELWFSSMGATDTFALVRDICDGVAKKVGKTVKADESKLNLIAIAIADANNAADALRDPTTQGFVAVYKGEKVSEINRMFREPSAYTQTLAYLLGQGAPVISVSETGCYYLDKEFNSHFQAITGTEEATGYDFATADYITLNYGGLGIMLEMF